MPGPNKESSDTSSSDIALNVTPSTGPAQQELNLGLDPQLDKPPITTPKSSSSNTPGKTSRTYVPPHVLVTPNPGIIRYLVAEQHST